MNEIKQCLKLIRNITKIIIMIGFAILGILTLIFGVIWGIAIIYLPIGFTLMLAICFTILILIYYYYMIKIDKMFKNAERRKL